MRLHLLQLPMLPVASVIMLQAIAIVAGLEQILLLLMMPKTTKALPALVVVQPSWATEQAALRQLQPPFTLRSS